MIIPFQILFFLFTVFALLSVIKRKKEGFLGYRGVLFWILFWLVALLIVFWPSTVVKIAHLLGIGRGSDLVFYISIITIFFLIFKLHIKLEHINRDITKIVRQMALDKIETKINFEPKKEKVAK